jgi:hypothetical protein
MHFNHQLNFQVEFPYFPMSVDGKQYVDDKYGDNHPIFNRSTVAQIYINTDQESIGNHSNQED